jgi:hypothetical protein
MIPRRVDSTADTITRGDIIGSASALAGSDCGTCKFISSPSRVGIVRRRTTQIQPKVPIQHLGAVSHNGHSGNEGWRLNSTTSSSRKCRSTIHPLRQQFTLVLDVASMRVPSLRIICLARMLRRTVGNQRTQFPALNAVTLHGQIHGDGSGHTNLHNSEILDGRNDGTSRKKSTRLPIKFPRIRPSLRLIAAQ